MLLLNNSLAARFTLHKRALLFSICTVLVLFIFQPFGTYESQLSYKYLRLAGYGLATFFAVFLTGMIEIGLSKYLSKLRYYSLLVICLHIFIIALFNHAYFVVAIYDQWHWQNQLMFIVYVMAIAIFPFTIMYFYEKHSATTLNDNNPAITKTYIDDIGGASEANQVSAPLVHITGENKTDALTVELTDLVLLKSADNYCEIITKKEDSISVNLLRVSLSKALAQLPPNKLIMRCHRSYGVNLSLVESSYGNANGLKLDMMVGDTTVPVSRAYVNSIKQALLVTPKHS